ncbi:MAG: hypothetical protein KAR09_03630 [Bacteroidales bacterium]|nr:hypothetical protein [Bacteroidales bacterium]
MKVRVEALIIDIAFPYIPVDIVSGRKGQKKQTAQERQAKDKKELLPGRPLTWKSFENKP